jgi:glycerophosphoryl diester phosphodiesterase
MTAPPPQRRLRATLSALSGTQPPRQSTAAQVTGVGGATFAPHRRARRPAPPAPPTVGSCSGSGPPPFVLIAHRGGQELFPENTMPAFLAAVDALQPHANLEFDVQLSADGVPVVIHDATLVRTACGDPRSVAELSLGQLMDVELEGGYRIPMLAQLLQAVAGRAHLHLELKSRQPGLVAACARELQRAGWLAAPAELYVAGGVTVFCPHLDQLDEVAALAPSACRMWAVSGSAHGCIDAVTLAAAAQHGVHGLCLGVGVGELGPCAGHDDLARQVALAHGAGLACRACALISDDLSLCHSVTLSRTHALWTDCGGARARALASHAQQTERCA